MGVNKSEWENVSARTFVFCAVIIDIRHNARQSTQAELKLKISFLFSSWSFGVLLWEIESGGITVLEK